MARIDRQLNVHYGQAYVEPYFESGEYEVVHLEDAFCGQANGLCGAASPGRLFLVTGLHTGQVNFTLDVFDALPPLDDTWEEIVEVSFTPAPGRVVLHEVYAIEEVCTIPLLQSTYRVRYCARKMELGREVDSSAKGEPVDSYALMFWLADSASDVIVKQTSQTATYRHQWAQALRI